MRRGFTQRVREIISGLGDFTLDDLSEPLGVRSFKEKAKVRATIQDLRKAGEVVSLRPGFYRFKGKETPFPMIAKMWRAMRIKAHFTLRDVVRLSGASKTHAHKFFMFLEREGFIENSNGGRGYGDGIYRLVDPENAPLDHPAMTRAKIRP